MPSKQATPRSSVRRQSTRTPSNRRHAVLGRAHKQPSGPALAARLRPKRSSAKGKSGFLPTVGRKVGDVTSDLKRTVSPSAGKKRLAAALAGVAGTLAATAAFIRWRGRQQHREPPASEPEAPATV
jgi:hypothetical protein